MQQMQKLLMHVISPVVKLANKDSIKFLPHPLSLSCMEEATSHLVR